MIDSLLFGAFGLVTVPTLAASQTVPDAVGLAIPYATNYGVGEFHGSGVNTRVLQFRPTITIVDHTSGKVGVGLRLSGSLGGYDLSNIIDFDLENVTTVGFTAGLELRVPTGNHGLLRPYADFGGVVNAQDRSLITTLFGAGLLAEFVFWPGTFEFGFEPRLEFVASRSTDRSFEEEYTAVFLKADVRHPLWFRGGRYLPSFGLYTQGGYYLDGIDLGVVGHIESELEVGVSFGLCPSPRIAIFRIPRISVGYGGSSAAQGWRITFSDRLLRCPEGRRG